MVVGALRLGGGDMIMGSFVGDRLVERLRLEARHLGHSFVRVMISSFRCVGSYEILEGTFYVGIRVVRARE